MKIIYYILEIEINDEVVEEAAGKWKELKEEEIPFVKASIDTDIRVSQNG